MLKEIDDLLHHWADQLKGRGMRQCSPLGRLAEFGGVMPSGGSKGSKDLMGLGDMDEAAWEVQQAVNGLSDELQVLAHEHYLWNGYNDAKAARLGLAERTYYDRLHKLHIEVREQLRSRSKQKKNG
ncbi:hypothetical protein HME01_22820 [Vreelandella aquamarina]|uniref:Uncharacterized protein n=1 Tax=Vreelandella aquamarina TaxID=77097 RepID=A0A1N6E8Z1_9GAMM|nr:hypothetical protein [Halomonas meridiana]GED46430.1 hypothetical protein HME01_22820 [Halomonas meridiana]SIN66518.1 hypothetical protein SAMN05878249_2152 [Halomonas meridiana]SIN79466.1 hypothetical protein SAMN05878438_3588 [Halomonas meridiana]SIO34067.1 hypothetical protein SAMN05878442_2455 [Halomonas meridiana]